MQSWKILLKSKWIHPFLSKRLIGYSGFSVKICGQSQVRSWEKYCFFTGVLGIIFQSHRNSWNIIIQIYFNKDNVLIITNIENIRFSVAYYALNADRSSWNCIVDISSRVPHKIFLSINAIGQKNRANKCENSRIGL